MRATVPILMAFALAACSTAPQPMGPNAEAEAKLQSLLAGKVAGQPTDCVPHWRTDRMTIIDDNTILFEDAGVVYRNELIGECSNLSNGFYSLLTKSHGGVGLCRGEIAQVVDTRTGITVGSCAIGEFVPYRTP